MTYQYNNLLNSDTHCRRTGFLVRSLLNFTPVRFALGSFSARCVVQIPAIPTNKRVRIATDRVDNFFISSPHGVGSKQGGYSPHI